MPAKKILLVDDSVSLRAVAGITLKGAGYEVIEACDGRDGLLALACQKVNLVISDLNMPGMDGLTFVKTVKQQVAYRYAPVIMLTTEGSAEMREKGRAAGVSAWLVKPFDPARLLEAVNKLILP